MESQQKIQQTMAGKNELKDREMKGKNAERVHMK
jgi:hypothetical protein